MSTLRDVAQRAGVSKMTVSRVLNRTGYVSPATRQRVEEVIAELGYVPNTLARSLRSKRTKTLALVLSDITNPFFTTLARGVEDVASDHGFNVIFCNTDESPRKQAEYLTVLVQKQVDGVLLVPARSEPEPVCFLQQRGIVVVVVDRCIPGVAVDVVRGESEQAACQLTEHLLALGHRRIAMLCGPSDVSTAIDRQLGYQRAYRQNGLSAPDELVFHDSYTVTGGVRMTQFALAVQPPPTALFAANNFIAIGAFQTLREQGWQVPADLSLVAFDDLLLTPSIEPFLTVASQPAYAMGRLATELLLARLASDTRSATQELVLPTALVMRRSTAPPAAASNIA